MKSWLALLCLAVSGCAVAIPLGEHGEYGELYGGYRLPGYGWQARHFSILTTPDIPAKTLSDK